ncbi:MAG: molybdopterin-dependent oxidoreductase [Halioglobus sp.]|nr:molybdopterin-dependent oxidoreductase [Halioglobus sp.]
MTITTKKTFCRFCLSCCGLEIDVDGDEALALRGDTSNPLSAGYTCLRGRELINIQQHPDRIRGALKRIGGSFTEITMTQALDEIAHKTQRLMDQYGGRAIASYNGSWAWSNLPTLPLSKSFHQAIASPSVFSPMTLDQPAKAFMLCRFGLWAGGIHAFKDADVVMFIGNNALLSQYSPLGGLPPYNPVRRLQDALDKGLQLLVIDPRKTEVASRATLHLQVRPGEDTTLLSGMIRIIIDEQLYDHQFCNEFIDDLNGLREMLEPFTLSYVSQRADVPREQITTAARMFAAGPRGAASTGTGPEMSPRGSLTEHMVMVINAICGRYYREGEEPAVAPPLSVGRQAKAQVVFPPQAWGEGFVKSRFRGLTQIGDEMPCNIMADEILTPGEGQIRALFCVGGNPMIAFPNQEKIGRALEDLPLLVAIDPWLSATSRRAHYILGPKVALERADATLLGEMYFEEPYAHYTEAVVEAQGDTIEEWEFFWQIAKRLGLSLSVHGQAVPMDNCPSKYQITELMTRDSRIPLSRVKADSAIAGGTIYPEARGVVAAKSPSNHNRFRVLPKDVRDQLQEVANEVLNESGSVAMDGSYSHLLISRRIKQFFNSTGHNLQQLKTKGTTNYAYMNSSDLHNMGIESGTLVEISSSTGTIIGVAKSSYDLKSGVVSMAHAFGDNNSDATNVRQQGSSTNRLVSDEAHFDSITGQARQSAIPVSISVYEET